MPNLVVANKACPNTNFKVDVKNGSEIKNYKHAGLPAKAGEVETSAANNKTKTYYRQEGDKNITPQRELSLSSSKYGIFDKVRRLDGNPGDISAKDLQVLKKSPSIWKKYGISSVKYDANAKTTGVYTSQNDQNPFIFKVK